MRNEQQIAQLLLNHQIVLIDTETIIGMSCIYTSTQAILALQALKQRSENFFFSVLCSSIDQAMSIGIFDDFTLSLGIQYWPFATLIVPKNFSYLHHNSAHTSNNIGIRVTTNPQLQNLIELIDQPLISTSVNIHTQPAAHTLEQALELFPLPYYQPTFDTLKLNKPSVLINTISTPMMFIRR